MVDWLTSAGEQLTAGDTGDDLSQEADLRARVAVYWHTYREHVPEIRALDQAALVNAQFAAQLAQLRDAQLQTMREHLARLRDAGFDLPGDPAILASAFNALLKGSVTSGWPTGIRRVVARSPTRKPSRHSPECSATGYSGLATAEGPARLSADQTTAQRPTSSGEADRRSTGEQEGTRSRPARALPPGRRGRHADRRDVAACVPQAEVLRPDQKHRESAECS